MGSLLAVLARLVTMAVSLVTGVITTRLILGSTDVEHYALYSLLITIPALLTFTDLGSGAVLVNSIATSDDPRADVQLRYQLTAVGRVLLAFATVAMALNTILLVTGGWRAIFGEAGRIPGAALAAFLCITIFCLGVPLGIWTRLMLGQGRNHIVILLQGLVSPLTLAGVWLMLQVGGSDTESYLAMASYFAMLIVAALGLAITARTTSPLVGSAARMIPWPKRFPSVRVMDVGWPMLAQTVTYPIAVGTQRYILAQFGSARDVAEYGVAGQVFFALNSLVLAAGVALWPHFAKRRHQGSLSTGPFGISALFAGGIAGATAVIWLVGPWLFAFISNGELDVRPATIIAFGAMVTMTAALYPLGMFIMDKPGIRFQVIPTLAMALVSVALAVILTPALGILGPLVAVVIAIAFCQYVPYAIYIRRHRDRLLTATKTNDE